MATATNSDAVYDELPPQLETVKRMIEDLKSNA